MKKKCLGCGKTFEDKISICQDCFQAIEQLRNSMDILPRRVQKKEWLFLRIITFICGWVLLAAWVFLLISLLYLYQFYVPNVVGASLGSIHKKLGQTRLFSLTFAFLFSFLIGFNLWNKFSAPNMIKRWSTRDWYIEGTIQKDLLELIEVFLIYYFFYLITLLGISLAGYYFRLQLLPSHTADFTKAVSRSLSLGCKVGFFIGVNISYYLSTDWMKKLNR